ncbi:MAG: proline racemase family protein [Hyphomicrobiales bacterium]|nr:proline racemase family protein [Hyphomicrobiales bacterium]MCP5372004.1 proline racemase family protein [Hyphomicrobiales bacterium]
MLSTRTITVVGCHAEGEVGRVITGGVLPPPGDTVFDQRTYLKRHGDDLRRLLLFEPRGGAFVHVNLVVPAKTPGAAAGFIIMEPDDYPPMSGSNSMCVATVLLETGMVAMTEPQTRLVLDAPAGPVTVVADCAGGKVRRVRVTNVPSFVFKLDAAVEVPGLATVTADLAYGGDTFAIVDAPGLGFALTRDEARDLVETGERIKAAVNDQHAIVHPENPAIDFVSFVQFAAPVEVDAQGRKSGRNTVVISPGKLDRSPTGTGCSARLAVLHARGRVAVGEDYVGRSILDTEFHCRIESETTVGGAPAVVPSIAGRTWITGVHQYMLDPDDPFPAGYTLNDTWFRAL